jgi:crossover junction endodeoxyribonuclease RuvC
MKTKPKHAGGVPRRGVRVLGIDPGLTRTGFGVIDQKGSKLSAVTHGVIKTSPNDSVPQRLRQLFAGLEALIEETRPDEVAIERLFFKANALTAVGAMQSAGVAMLAASIHGLEVTEYQPATVKLAVVGVGSASKEQVAYMVEKLVVLGAQGPPELPDAHDALAVSICHINSRSPHRAEAVL